jgi:EAL domain-containing protein (putative c-di-GMP-specific phosphodiesterase class I)
MLLNTFAAYPALSLSSSASREHPLALAPPPRRPADPSARLPTAAELAAALQGGALRTAFQPQVALATGALIGIEALARWTDATLGEVPPDRFIPLAERSGLIGALTQAVLRDSLAAVIRLRRLHPGVTVSVNISPVLLDDPGLPERIALLLAEAELPPSALVVEVTEGRPFSDPARAGAVLAALRAQGIGCAMDDFGTGYATLPALLRMPFTELKIDRSFVARAADLPEAGQLVRATIKLGQALGLRVVAEGIETEAVERLLREAGCDAGQGFRYGRPMPMEALLECWSGGSTAGS